MAEWPHFRVSPRFNRKADDPVDLAKTKWKDGQRCSTEQRAERTHKGNPTGPVLDDAPRLPSQNPLLAMLRHALNQLTSTCGQKAENGASGGEQRANNPIAIWLR